MSTKQTVFRSKTYKSYLLERFGAADERRGIKSKAATAIGCQPTYISQVLHDKAHLSLEQADALNVFLAHSKREAQYFLLLVQRDRSGTVSLRKHFDDLLEKESLKQLSLTKRLGSQSTLTTDQQARYYSSWHFAAVHIALTIPDLQTRESLADFFKIPLRRVQFVLDFLLECGLAEKQDVVRHVPGSSFIRLGNESPLIHQHHSNWRHAAIRSLDFEGIGDLHYSAVVTLSKQDARRLKERMLDEIQSILEIVRPSKEEELFAYTVDFFSLRQ